MTSWSARTSRNRTAFSRRHQEQVSARSGCRAGSLRATSTTVRCCLMTAPSTSLMRSYVDCCSTRGAQGLTPFSYRILLISRSEGRERTFCWWLRLDGAIMQCLTACRRARVWPSRTSLLTSAVCGRGRSRREGAVTITARCFPRGSAACSSAT
jgi:hypothetical protein